MTDAQRLFIERSARTCERRMELADIARRLGSVRVAEEHLRVAALASDFAFYCARVQGGAA